MIIEHIDQVLPHVTGRRDFVVAKKDGYTVIDYVYVGHDTFDEPVRHECRGIKFGPDGRILARPFHKFFNVGERSETRPEAIDWARRHFVVQKLDGSMIHPAIVHDKLVFMTRMGHTDVAKACEIGWLDGVTSDFCRHWLNCGYTPIFEWTAPHNRIVVGYTSDRLSLLAIRHTVNGVYLPQESLHAHADGIFPVPEPFQNNGNWATVETKTKTLEGEEGYVVWFDDGFAVKVKSPWYAIRHRALDGLRFEHHVVRLVLDNGIDDVLPMLSADDSFELHAFASGLNASINRLVDMITLCCYNLPKDDRKAAAMEIKESIPPVLTGCAFKIYDGGIDPRSVVIELFLKNCVSGPRIAELLQKVPGAPRWRDIIKTYEPNNEEIDCEK